MTNTTSETTKKQLAMALKEQMSKKPLERITIKDLTDHCGLRRATFYYHFEDIYDLVKWMLQEEAVALLEQQQKGLLWEEGLLQLFQYVQENRGVCLCAFKSMGREHIRRFFEADIHALIYRTVEEVGRSIGASDRQGIVDMELMTHYFVIALAAILESWLLGEIERSPEELVQFIQCVLQDQISGTKLRIEQKI